MSLGQPGWWPTICQKKVAVKTRVPSHPLVEPNKIMLPPLHIKSMKRFLKAMDRESSRFAFIKENFPRISMEKLKAGISDGPQIRKLMKDPIFDEALREVELSSRQSLKSVVINFLGNNRSAEYEKEIEGLLKSFQGTNCQSNCTFCGDT